MSDPRLSKGSSESSISIDLAMLEVEFWRLWSKFPTARSCELQRLHGRLDTTFCCIAKTPITSVPDAAIKARVALQRASWTPECFDSYAEDDPVKLAAEILDQVVGYLERLADTGTVYEG